MRKFWVLYSPIDKTRAADHKEFDTYEAAEEAARQAFDGATNRSEIVIMEAMTLVKRSYPPVEIIKIS